MRCRVDGAWETRDKFSIAQLKKWDQAQQRRKITDVTCRTHTSGAVQELRCDTCGQFRELGFFSKNARKNNGGRRDCRDCIDWTEADQVGGRPLPMPGGLRDESEWDLAKTAREEKEILAKFEDMSVGDKTTSTMTTTTTTATETRSEYLDEVMVKGIGGNLNQNLGPTLTTKNLNKFLKANKSVASTGGASTAKYHPSSAPSVNLSAVEAPANIQPAARGQQSRIQYQAIGPNGIAQMRTQSTVNPYDSASVTTATNPTTATAGNGNFARPSGRKTNPDTPNYILREGKGTQFDQAYDSDLSDDHA